MRHNLIVPYGPYLCGDDQFLNLAIQSDHEWSSFCEHVLARSELATDARFATNEARLAHREILESLIEEIFSASKRETWIERLDQAGIAWGNVNDVRGLAAHEQLHARSRWSTVEVNGQPFEMLTHPMNLDGTIPRNEPVPTIGRHTQDILRELGYDAAGIEALHQASVV